MTIKEETDKLRDVVWLRVRYPTSNGVYIQIASWMWDDVRAKVFSEVISRSSYEFQIQDQVREEVNYDSS